MQAESTATFGDLLRRHRLSAGLTQEQLAERAGLSVYGVQKLERGATHPYRDTAQRLAAALDLVPDETTRFQAAVQPVRRRGSPLPEAPERHARGGHNLSLPATSLIGREQELIDIPQRLKAVRLLTLTGVGGCGKTRLAIEVAHRAVEDYPDGVWLVELAPVADPTLVGYRPGGIVEQDPVSLSALITQSIAQTLGVREVAGRPLSESVAAHLSARQLLLLLDNFEHLVDAAQVVGELLAACPQLTVLATSREPLHLRAEQAIAVSPLALPRAERDAPIAEISRCASVRLFAQRAAQSLPQFALTPDNARTVADICLRLDGLPLAIELAAARTSVLSPTLLLDRLKHRLPLLVRGARDLPERQRTLRNTIAWSYDLLDPGDKHLFRHLAVFAGGCTLEAAEALAVEAETNQSVLDGITSLVEKNVLKRAADFEAEPRFIMLETIREFALEQLEISGERAEARRAHAVHYMTWLLETDPRRSATPRSGWVHRIDLDYDNLRAAMRWSLDHDVSLALATGTVLTRYGIVRGYLRELRLWWDEALQRSTGGEPTLWSTAAFLLAIVLFLRGDNERIFALLEEGLAQFRAHGHKRGIAHCLFQLGVAAPLRGDPRAAVPLLREAEALFRELGLPEDVGWTVWGLGSTAQLQGDYASAEMFFAEALAIVRALHDPISVVQALAVEALSGQALAGLGSVARLQGDLDRADAYLREGVLIHTQVNDLATCVMHLAGVAVGRGYGLRAARLLGAAEGLWGSMDSDILPAYRPVYDQICTDLTRRLGARTLASMRARGRRMRLSTVIAYALAGEENLAADGPLKDLTPREKEVARLVARGLTNREIAAALVLAEGTARVHVEHVLAKLDLHSRAQLAAWAVEHNVSSSSSSSVGQVAPRI